MRLKVDCESSWGSFSTSMLEATPACTRCRRRLPQSLSAWKRDIVRSRAGNLEKPAGEGLIVYVSNPEKSHPSLQACLQRQGSKTALPTKQDRTIMQDIIPHKRCSSFLFTQKLQTCSNLIDRDPGKVNIFNSNTAGSYI